MVSVLELNKPSRVEPEKDSLSEGFEPGTSGTVVVGCVNPLFVVDLGVDEEEARVRLVPVRADAVDAVVGVGVAVAEI